MLGTVIDVFKWTSCSDECELEMWRHNYDLRDTVAYCIHDRVRGYCKRIHWDVIYEYADKAMNGEFANIDILIEDFCQNIAA